MARKRNILIAVIVICGLTCFYLISNIFSTPAVTDLKWHIPDETAFMKESEAEPVHEYVKLSQISIYLKQAVVLAEDDRFTDHGGVDIEAMKKALKTDWKRKKFSHGASTITMQLARNLYLSPSKTPFRKLKEILIAAKLERELTKDRILEVYLNVEEWGCGVFGAEAAAKHYFKKSAVHLGKHEAAFLAAILPRPCFYDKRRGGNFLQRRMMSIESRL